MCVTWFSRPPHYSVTDGWTDVGEVTSIYHPDYTGDIINCQGAEESHFVTIQVNTELIPMT